MAKKTNWHDLLIERRNQGVTKLDENNLGYNRNHSTEQDAKQHESGNRSDAYVEKNYNRKQSRLSAGAKGPVYQQLFEDPESGEQRLIEDRYERGILGDRDKPLKKTNNN